MAWNPEEFVKEGHFYRGPIKEWEIDLYGFAPRGLSDLIYNTLRKIIETNDTSMWAYASFTACADLLFAGKRWPDNLEGINCSKNRFDCAWSKIKYRLGIKQFKAVWVPYEEGGYVHKIEYTRKYRWQHGMTRDPWVMFYCCAIHLNRPQYLKFKQQWWLYRPEHWAWRKALVTHKKGWYLFWKGLLAEPRKDFVIVLDRYMFQYFMKVYLSS